VQRLERKSKGEADTVAWLAVLLAKSIKIRNSPHIPLRNKISEVSFGRAPA
jgi:hypothetical protein